jgi:hypothetical protein
MQQFDLDSLCLQEGSVMAFNAERQPEAIKRDGPDRTLSGEAMDALFLHIKAWIGSRMIRSMDKFDHPPQRIDIVVAMTIDGEPAR